LALKFFFINFDRIQTLKELYLDKNVIDDDAVESICQALGLNTVRKKIVYFFK